MTYAIAIDPGHTGGAALVAPDIDGRMVLCAWGAWRKTGRRTDRYDALGTTSAGGVVPMTRHPNLMAAMLAAAPWLGGPSPVAVVEGLTPHGARIGYTQLCEAAGVGVALVGGGALRPTSTRWRSDVLRLPATTAADVAEHEARVAWGWADDVRGRTLTWERRLHPVEPPSWAAGHVAEAACMAAWGLMRKK